MELTNETIVINPSDEPLAPVEQAIVAYQQFREERKLPDGWTQEFMMVPSTLQDKYWQVGLPGYSDDGPTIAMTCCVEGPDYTVELVFGEYSPAGDGQQGARAVGGFRLEFFRKDYARPTDVEAVGMAKLFTGPHFGIVPQSAASLAFDGKTTARPLPTTRHYSPGKAGEILTWSYHIALLTEPQVEEAIRSQRSVAIPVVYKWNTETNSRMEMGSLLQKELHKLESIRRWVRCQSLLRAGRLAENHRRTVLADAKHTEIEHGTRHVKALAGMYRDREGHATEEERLKRAEFHVAGRIEELRRLRDALDNRN